MRKANKEIVKSHRSTLFYVFNWILTMIISCAVPFLQCKTFDDLFYVGGWLIIIFHSGLVRRIWFTR